MSHMDSCGNASPLGDMCVSPLICFTPHLPQSCDKLIHPKKSLQMSE